MLGDISGLERIYIVCAYLNHKSIKTLEKKIASYPAYRECNRWHIDTWTDQGRKPGNCQRLYILDIGCTDYI